MKKLLVLVSVVLICFTNAGAQSKLHVRLADNSQISVAINGRHFPQHGSSITIGDLPPGRHSLKIYTTRYDRWGSNYQSLAFNGAVRTVNGMVTNFTYSPYTNRIDMQRQNIDDNAPYNPTDNQLANSNKNDEQPTQPTTNDVQNFTPASPLASPVTTSDATTATTKNGGSLTEKKMDKLKEKVAAKNTDTEKLKLMKEEMKKEFLSTSQVSKMMDWLLFESTRVEFAKWAYPITSDKENYSTLTKKLSYKNSQEELEDFLKEQQR